MERGGGEGRDGLGAATEAKQVCRKGRRGAMGGGGRLKGQQQGWANALTPNPVAPAPTSKVHEVFSTRGQRDFIMMRTKGVDGEGGKHGAH